MNLNSSHLAQFIRERGIKAEIIRFEADTPTVAVAAEVLGVRPEQIIKSVLFLADGEAVLVVANGLSRIAWKRLADYLQISRRRLKTATAEQVLMITGYVVGSVPPFGHRQQLRTIVEPAVLRQTVVYGGGGEINALLRLTTVELKRVVGDEVVELAQL